MAIDSAVAMARSRLANICRAGGDPEEIANARDALKIAKAERLRQDADALEGSVQERRKRVLLLAGPTTAERVTPEQHEALYTGQRAEAQAFLREHPRPAKGAWDDETQDLWDALLAKHTRAHEALGCPRTSICRTRQG